MIRRKEEGGLPITYSMRYRNLVEIGCGTFGKVYRGVHCGQCFALKEYTYAGTPVHATTVREIRALRSLRHPNIIELLEIVVDRYKIWAVFPLCETDLGRLIHSTRLSADECRHLLRGILLGVQHMHSRGIVHRDLKAANVLLKRSGGDGTHGASEDDGKRVRLGDPAGILGLVVKICDMGMARPTCREMTPGVVTLWYRAPELLLGSSMYDSAVDIWSIGCVLFEMAAGTPLFRGESEVRQLELIARVCGKIGTESMPLFGEYPLSGKLHLPGGDRAITVDYQYLNSAILDLVDKMLVLDPRKRLPIQECLAHPFLSG